MKIYNELISEQPYLENQEKNWRGIYEKCSTSFIIRKIEMKAIIMYHILSVKVTCQKIWSVGKDV